MICILYYFCIITCCITNLHLYQISNSKPPNNRTNEECERDENMDLQVFTNNLMYILTNSFFKTPYANIFAYAFNILISFSLLH